MNIFVLDTNPRLAAEYHCDKHVVKMITESAQLLCSAYWATGQSIEPPYQLSHYNHPCAKWVRYSKENWDWLLMLGLYLYREYRYRYGNNIHKAGETLIWLYKNQPDLPSRGNTPFVLCMPEDCKQDDAVESYREYYRKYKTHILQYRRRKPPEWLEVSDEH